MEGSNSPLALNAWDADGPHSYVAAINAIDTVVDPEKDGFYAANPQLTNFITNALYDRIASQSQKNYEQYQKIVHALSTEERAYTQGAKNPAELAAFLWEHDNLESIEVGRRTHPRIWDTYAHVDAPIRQNLDGDSLLMTTRSKSPALYRMKNLNIVGSADQYYVLVDRKRTVRSHFGGHILTIVRNSIVLHNSDGMMPLDLRHFIANERQAARREDAPEYDYDKHSDDLRDLLETHVSQREDGNKPSWIIPILTTYYAAKKHAVKADVLKQVDERPRPL